MTFKLLTFSMLFLVCLIALSVMALIPVWGQDLEFGPPFIITDSFNVPTGLAIDEAHDQILIADTGNRRVVYTSVSALQTTPTWRDFGFLGDQALPEALNAPQAVAVDSLGNAYVVDTFGNEVQLYRWNSAASTYIYDPSFAETTRNTVDGIEISLPRDIAVSSSGIIYLLDSGNNRILVANGPDDTSWALWREDNSWGNPYGIDVAADEIVYIADTDNHRIIRILPTGEEEIIGHFGTGPSQFRFPHDVAVATDGKLFVADTFNHRVVVLSAEGGYYRTLGAAPLFSNVQKIAVDSNNRVFAIDAQLNRLVAFLGPAENLPFDAYVRDYVGDDGEQPSDESFVLSSPDILIRHNPDIDLAVAAEIGLESFAFQQPRYGENNYIYIAARNRGNHEITAASVNLYWADPSNFATMVASTVLLSVASDGGQANGDSFSPAISTDGRYIAFTSWATNLVDDDTNDTVDIFVHDQVTGHTTRVSVASDGGQANNGSVSPAISVDGRYITFESSATNLVDDDTNDTVDIFVHDQVTGHTTRVSVASDGGQGNWKSFSPAISTDGRYIAFESSATNLVDDDTNDSPDIFLHDQVTGHTTRVSVASDGGQANNGSVSPTISADGRYITFVSDARNTNLVDDDTNDGSDIFVHDRVTGHTTRVSIDSDGGQGNGGSFFPAISADGRYIAFTSHATNLVDDDTNGDDDIFVHDRVTGYTTRVSVASDGGQVNGGSYSPAISADGRYIALASFATNLVDDDTNDSPDIFLHDHWGEPSKFPVHWNMSNFYSYYADASSNRAGNSLFISSIAPDLNDGLVETDGVTVVGPIVWRPPAPESADAGDGNFYLLTRLVHQYDVSEPVSNSQQVRANNNVGLRQVKVTRAPFPVGDQDTLVVSVHFPDIEMTIDPATVNARVAQANQWLHEVSYGSVTINPLMVGPITLDHESQYYASADQNLLVDMTTEVLNKIALAEPNLLDGQTSSLEDDIDRILIVLNDPDFVTDWATTGHWPYNVDGVTRYLSVSVQGPNNTMEQYAHGLLHQFGLVDLYLHENVEFPGDRLAADGWDNMAKPINGVHPLVWSKELATWITSDGCKIFYIPRPAAGMPPRLDEPDIHLSFQSIANTEQYCVVAIGLTEGVTTFEEETHFYFVEARNDSLGNYDRVPSSGVLMYYANSLIPQGQAPILVRDHVPTTLTLDDAVVTVGQSESPAGTGINMSVIEELPDSGGYMINVDYDPPPDDYNVYIQVGDPASTSPDIWIDNQRDGGYESYNATDQTSAGPVSDQPLGEEENRIYARVHNTGPAPAFDIEVVFSLSAPWHTVGGQTEFVEYKTEFIDEIPPGGYRDVYVTWVPDGDRDPHNCIEVTLRRLFDDTNAADNRAQQNVTVRTSNSSSPFDSVQFSFQISNSETEPLLVYFQAEGIPSEWKQELTPGNGNLLQPAQNLIGTLSVQPPDDAEICTDHPIYVTAWTPRGDTLVRLGGTSVDVQLRQRTKLSLQSDVICSDPSDPGSDGFDPDSFLDHCESYFGLSPDECFFWALEPEACMEYGFYPEECIEIAFNLERCTAFDFPPQECFQNTMSFDQCLEAGMDPDVCIDFAVSLEQCIRLGIDPRQCKESALTLEECVAYGLDPPACYRFNTSLQECRIIETSGCTDPVRANERVIITYKDASGNPEYHEVFTDEFGCYSDFSVITSGGDWQIASYYSGNQCFGSAQTSIEVSDIPEPSRNDALDQCLGYGFGHDECMDFGLSADYCIQQGVDPNLCIEFAFDLVQCSQYGIDPQQCSDSVWDFRYCVNNFTEQQCTKFLTGLNPLRCLEQAVDPEQCVSSALDLVQCIKYGIDPQLCSDSVWSFEQCVIIGSNYGLTEEQCERFVIGQ